MARYKENGVGEGKNIVRVHPALREEIENIRMIKYNGRVPFTQASYDLVEQKRILEKQNKDLQKKVDELIGKQTRRSNLL